MRYKLLSALIFITCAAQAQQINPVPDYVFANRMSVGRNAVTDTLAYFSIGPRYGAIRGFMPPMVVDTALVTGGTKRNGLTIFSIQKNKYVYWDSVRVQWSDFAGSSGAYIFATDTASMLSPYTRGSGTTNYLPKFTGTRTFGNSLAYDNGTELLVNTTVDSGSYTMQVNGNIYTKSGLFIDGVREFEIGNNGENAYQIIDRQLNQRRFVIDSAGNIFMGGTLSSVQGGNAIASARNGEFYVNNNSTDAGSYALQVTGEIYNTTGAALSVSSGHVGIGTTTANLENNSAVKELTISKLDAATNICSINMQGDRSADGAVNSRVGTINFWQSTNNIARINGVRATANNSGAIDFQTDNAGGGLTGRMRIQSNGEVNIDATGTYTDAGAYALQVAGATYGTGAATMSAFIPTGSTIAKNGMYLPSTNAVAFSTDSTERMRINSGGELIIGTTVDAGTYVLQTNGSAIFLNASGTNPGVSTFNSSNSAAITSFAADASLNLISYQSVSGSPYTKTSAIIANADGTVPSVLQFWTKTNGQSSAAERMRITSDGELLIGTTTDAGAYALQVTGAIYNTTTLTTGAPTSGTAKPWRLGEAATVSPTSPNRTIRVEIDGTVYYLHAKTTND